MSFAETLVAAFVVKANIKDVLTQHDISYESKIECPITELQQAHNNYMKAQKKAKSYQKRCQAAHDNVRNMQKIIDDHEKCEEYWTWYNANAYYLLQELQK